MKTEFLRVEQRTAYNNCITHAVGAIKFPDDCCARAYNWGFSGKPNKFDTKGNWYAYWCAGKDTRDNMRKAA